MATSYSTRVLLLLVLSLLGGVAQAQYPHSTGSSDAFRRLAPGYHGSVGGLPSDPWRGMGTGRPWPHNPVGYPYRSGNSTRTIVHRPAPVFSKRMRRKDRDEGILNASRVKDVIESTLSIRSRSGHSEEPPHPTSRGKGVSRATLGGASHVDKLKETPRPASVVKAVPPGRPPGLSQWGHMKASPRLPPRSTLPSLTQYKGGFCWSNIFRKPGGWLAGIGAGIAAVFGGLLGRRKE